MSLYQNVTAHETYQTPDALFILGYVPNAGGHWIIERRNNISGGSSGHGYGDDESAARAAWQEIVSGPRCRECNGPTAFDASCNYADKSLCHSCWFWSERVKEHGPTVAVIDGYRYSIAPDKPTGYPGMLGHGGSEFTIRFHDGREVVTRNLWANGRVPDRFRARLSDNAEFIQKAKFSAYVGHGSAAG